MARPFAWSYSRLALYEKCPAQHAHKNIWKTPPGPGYKEDPEFFLRGRRIHGGMAAYLTGQPFYSDQDKITYTEDQRLDAKKYSAFIAMVEEIKSNLPLVEQQWGYDGDYRPTSWFGKSTYWRVVLDAGVLWPDNKFSGVDWKTGRPSADNEEQMEQFALGVFRRYQQVNWVEMRLAYLDTGQDVHTEFVRSDAQNLLRKWEKRVEPMANDQTFAPRPGNHCRYCPFAKSKGGPCAFG